MVTTLDDYIKTDEFYRIPAPMGAGESSNLSGCIAEGEKTFADTFGVSAEEADREAVKYFVFSFWLRNSRLVKTANGLSAKVRYNQADANYDQKRAVTAYNRACKIMKRTDLKLKPILNY